jgi:hypothetical protein
MWQALFVTRWSHCRPTEHSLEEAGLQPFRIDELVHQHHLDNLKEMLSVSLRQRPWAHAGPTVLLQANSSHTLISLLISMKRKTGRQLQDLVV